MITDLELDFVREALRMAQEAGAQHARATLSNIDPHPELHASFSTISVIWPFST